MRMMRNRRFESKMRTRFWLPLVLGSVTALIHLLLIAGILFNPNGGSWSEVLAFAVDFPISITFVWLSHFVSLVLLHMTIGSVWWFTIVWALARGLMWITDRTGAHNKK